MPHSTTSNLSGQDFFTTTLTQNVGVSDTIINIASVPTASEGYLIIDPNNVGTREVIYYNSKTSSTVTCPDATQGSSRGIGGTTAQTHQSGTLVEMRAVWEYFAALQNGQSMGVNSVQAQNLATSAITLGYAQITGNITTTSTSQTQATGLTVTVTIPSGGRQVKITFAGGSFSNNGSAKNTYFTLWDGTVGSGTQIGGTQGTFTANYSLPIFCQAVVTPSAGSKTYNVGWAVDSTTTGTLVATSTAPVFILVEVI